MITEGTIIIYHCIDDFVALGPLCSKEYDVNLQIPQLICYDLVIPFAAEKLAIPISALNPWDQIDNRWNCSIGKHKKRIIVSNKDFELCLHSTLPWLFISPTGHQPPI